MDGSKILLHKIKALLETATQKDLMLVYALLKKRAEKRQAEGQDKPE